MKKLLLSALCAVSVTGAFVGNTLFPAYAGSSEIVTEDFSEIEYSFGDISLNFADVPEILSNYGEFSYNFRDQLDPNNGAVYDAMTVLTTPTEEKITVKLPEPVTITLSHLPSSSSYTEEDEAIFTNGIFSSLKNGIDALLLDMPEIFWFDEANLAIGIGESQTRRNWLSGNYSITINSLVFVPAYHQNYGSIDGVLEYKTKLENAIADFPVEGKSRYEQLKSIHDYICKFTYYDVDANFYSSAVGAIVEPGVVCEGYSKSFKLICDRLDIPCVLIFGNLNTETRTAHMWNYVQMEDGNWYAVDVTWDDVDGKNGIELKHDYFLKGSDTFNKNHSADGDHDFTHLTYPELSVNDYVQGTETTTSKTTTSTTTTSTTTTSTTTTSKTTTSKTTTSATTTSTTTTSTTTTSTTATSKTTTSTTTTSTTATSKTTTSATTASKTTTSTTSKTKPTTSKTTTTEPTTAEPDLSGDLNHDGNVNIADLVYCFRAVMGENTQYSCDYNGDGLTDSFDLVLMRQLIISK